MEKPSNTPSAAPGADDTPLDCIIVGGGPAGLTAALYLARYRRRVALIDGGDSRARWIPVSHNFPGFPDGVTGPGLLDRLHQQIAQYDVAFVSNQVDGLARRGPLFVATLGDRTVLAEQVLLATGVSDVGNREGAWTAAIKRGAVRLCPICDAYEVTGKKVALLARGTQVVSHALFLRTYTRELTLVRTDTDSALSAADRQTLAEAGITLIEDTAPELVLAPPGQSEPVPGAVVVTSDGRRRTFDTVYPMFGCHPRSELAQTLGAECDADGNLLVDAHQATSVPGLYAAGDLVSGLNQISVAVGHAAVAATAIHNRAERQFA